MKTSKLFLTAVIMVMAQAVLSDTSFADETSKSRSVIGKTNGTTTWQQRASREQVPVNRTSSWQSTKDEGNPEVSHAWSREDTNAAENRRGTRTNGLTTTNSWSTAKTEDGSSAGGSRIGYSDNQAAEEKDITENEDDSRSRMARYKKEKERVYKNSQTRSYNQ